VDRFGGVGPPNLAPQASSLPCYPLCELEMVNLLSRFPTVSILAVGMLGTVVLAGLIACAAPDSTSRPFHPECAPYESLEPDTSWWEFGGGKPVFSFWLPFSFQQINKDEIGIDSYPGTFQDSTADSTAFRIGFDYGRWGGGIGGERDYYVCRSVDTTTVAGRKAVVGRFKSNQVYQHWEYRLEVVFLRDRPFPLSLWDSVTGRSNGERLGMYANCPRRADCAVARGVFESVELVWWY